MGMNEINIPVLHIDTDSSTNVRNHLVLQKEFQVSNKFIRHYAINNDSNEFNLLHCMSIVIPQLI